MSGLGSWLWGTSQLDDAIDKATSELLPAGAEDIALNLEICDQIRSKSAPAKDAMRALKRRLNHKNPNVQNLALSLTDICVKNGGDLFLNEIASREFIDNLVSILKIPTLNNDVKNNILRYVQNWSLAFEGKPALSYVGTVYKTLKSEGFTFPPKDFAAASSAMVDTSQAPEWIDSDVCLRCRTAFTFTNRKHHCRNCGQVFDQQCSSKSMPLPHFGITQEVRVCDGCYNKMLKKADKSNNAKSHKHSHSAAFTPASPTTKPKHRSARDLADEELQRAIQLSLEESQKSASSAHTGNHARPGYVPYQPDSSANRWQPSEPPLVDRDTRPSDRKTSAEEEDDPDLKAAIEASLRELNAPKPSAPTAETPVQTPYGHPNGYQNSYMPAESNSATPVPTPSKPVPNYDLAPMESDAILTFTQTVEQAEAQGGSGYLARHPGVVEMYDRANGLRPKLAMGLDDAGRKEQILTDMHDKLSQAVKLYDHILTEQIAHPRWRSPVQAQPSTSYQQPQQQQAAYTNGYSQWAPAPTSYQPQQPLQSQYAQQYSPTPAQAAPAVANASAPVSSSPELDRSYIYQSQAPAPTANLPPVSILPQQYGYQVASPPPQQVASPPPPPQQVQQPPSPQLARHKSLAVSHQPIASPPPVNAHAQPNAGLARSHTVSAPGRQAQAYNAQQLQQQQQWQYAQQQHQQQLASQLMQAPVAPTNVLPQFPAVPTGVPLQQEERKEAMLIDL